MDLLEHGDRSSRASSEVGSGKPRGVSSTLAYWVDEFWFAVRQIPYLSDVLFGGLLACWGVNAMLFPHTVAEMTAWHLGRTAAQTLGCICFFFGSGQFFAALFRRRKYRLVMGALCFWAFLALENQNTSRPAHISYGGYCVGEALIVLGAL